MIMATRRRRLVTSTLPCALARRCVYYFNEVWSRCASFRTFTWIFLVTSHRSSGFIYIIDRDSRNILTTRFFKELWSFFTFNTYNNSGWEITFVVEWCICVCPWYWLWYWVHLHMLGHLRNTTFSFSFSILAQIENSIAEKPKIQPTRPNHNATQVGIKS